MVCQVLIGRLVALSVELLGKEVRRNAATVFMAVFFWSLVLRAPRLEGEFGGIEMEGWLWGGGICAVSRDWHRSLVRHLGHNALLRSVFRECVYIVRNTHISARYTQHTYIDSSKRVN